MRRVLLFLKLCGAAALACACSGDKPSPQPYLVALEVIAPDGTVTDLLAATDASVQLQSPFATVRATFSALLDASKIQDLTGPSAKPGQGVARALWQRPQAVVELPLLATYNPSDRARGVLQPTVTLSPSGVFPTDASITIQLDPSRLTSKTGQPYVGATQ